MKIIALSGWGQPYDALADALPEATHVDYVSPGSVDAAFTMLASHADADMVVGWSMGGQIAARAIQSGIIKPKKLVLIASPYQFAANNPLPIGMGEVTFRQYRENLERDHERTLNKSYSLIAHGDMRAEHLKPRLALARQRLERGRSWLYWFDRLAEHSFHAGDFSRFPHTLLIHGDKDVVIGIEQAHAFARALPSSDLHIFEGCGHAPHWHDPERVRNLVEG